MAVLSNLDIRTAYLIAGLASWLSAVALILLRDFHRPSRSGSLAMAASFCLGGVCLVMASIRDASTSAFALWFGLLCGAACFAFMLEATRHFFGRTSSYRFCAIAIALQGAALAFSPNPTSILLLHHGFQVIYSMLMLSIMLRAQNEVARVGRYGMIALLSCYATSAMMRFFDAMYSNDVLLLTPTMKSTGIPGLVALLYALSPIVMMLHVLAILNARQVAELTVAASTDELTGLASRRFLLSTASQWRKAVEGQNSSCALLMIDADNFKAINDRFGHETGDEVLRHLARTLNTNLRSDAILARYGGEEFCALVPIDRPAEAQAAAERLRHAVELAPFRKGVTQISLTISIGVAMHGTTQSLQEVLRVADRRVYQAKDLGRNRVVSEDQLPEPTMAMR